MPNMERRRNALKFWASLIITAAHALIWAFVWGTYYVPLLQRTFYWKGNLLVTAAYTILLIMLTGLYGGYRVGYYRPADVALSGVIALLFSNGLTWLQACLISADLITPLPILAMTAAQTALTSVWALQMSKLYARLVPPRRMLLVYGGTDLARRLVYKMLAREEKYRIQESISVEDGLPAVREKILGFSAVILCDVPAKTRNTLLKFCFEKGIRTYTTPKISDILVRGATYINLFDSPLLLNRNGGLTLEQQLVKRGMDLALVGLATVALSPLMLAIAAAVKLCDGGPVLYTQDRLTIGGKVFRMHKFRSMRVNAEAETGAQLSAGEDDRITPVGRVIRRFRLDELPQFFDILRGDMSLVGPRPERPEIAAEYLRDMPEFDYRLKVKAGLTGFAQVVGRYNTTPYDKLKMDIMYISNYSTAEDFKIILTTLKILFFRDKTEGVGVGDGQFAGEENERV